MWASDFQFDSTTDGRAVKIASMIDEHTRESLLHLVERSITADKLVAELEKVFTTSGGPPRALRMDAGNGPSQRDQRRSRVASNYCLAWVIHPKEWPTIVPGYRAASPRSGLPGPLLSATLIGARSTKPSGHCARKLFDGRRV